MIQIKMENFNINDMKALFGPTPINQLPGVQGYANHKTNWLLVVGGFVVGIGFYWLMAEGATKGNKIFTLQPKKHSPPEEKSEQEIEDAIQNHFNKFDLEIEETDEFD